jgi:hypothetical protein
MPVLRREVGPMVRRRRFQGTRGFYLILTLFQRRNPARPTAKSLIFSKKIGLSQLRQSRGSAVAIGAALAKKAFLAAFAIDGARAANV